ncbi:hypothetical protein ACFW9F_29360 [Streptomyces sp. NPDC059506]|uniref:hypothetical protein n=1 Tax=Streptomyces sp. NPDC059506 TaxID=3347751 RepID=UPI00369D1E76
MSIATPATATTVERVRPPQVSARTGNANIRAALAQGIHPASGRPLLPGAPATGCGTCALSYIRVLTAPDGRDVTGTRLKCSQAPISRRGHQGPDLRPDTPACASYQATGSTPSTSR